MEPATGKDGCDNAIKEENIADKEHGDIIKGIEDLEESEKEQIKLIAVKDEEIGNLNVENSEKKNPEVLHVEVASSSVEKPTVEPESQILQLKEKQPPSPLKLGKVPSQSQIEMQEKQKKEQAMLLQKIRDQILNYLINDRRGEPTTMQQISTKLKAQGFMQRDIVSEVTKLLEIEEKMTKECQT